MNLFFTIAIFFFVVFAQAQHSEKHIVFFEQGQAYISLQQLDSIKEIALKYKETINSRIVVFSYADDALDGDSNYRLSEQRALLLQQCLEREGVSREYLQIENKVRHITEQEGCGACAEILLTQDINFFNQNVNKAKISEFLINASSIDSQIFWVKPFENSLITTKEGVLIRIPHGAFATKDSSLLKLEMRFLKNKLDFGRRPQNKNVKDP